MAQPASYAFATELGSGLYDFCGRSLQAYRLPLRLVLREARLATVGVRAHLPLTLGFLDFEQRDVLSSGLPRRLDSFSFVLGLELEVQLRECWRLKPYLTAGGTVASGALDAWLYGAGVRSELDRQQQPGADRRAWSAISATSGPLSRPMRRETTSHGCATDPSCAAARAGAAASASSSLARTLCPICARTAPALR